MITMPIRDPLHTILLISRPPRYSDPVDPLS